jgi:hypothetical protein
MDQLKCKLVEYAISYSAKVMWGMDCDLEELLQEILKIQGYIFVMQSLETPNDCETIIPVDLIQKIDAYIASLNRRRNATCRNCN